MKEMRIGFIGNPNCGKTTLFNAFTGANLKVANWPGVTVEKIEGAIQRHNTTIHLVDVPGTYSLTSYTMEEEVTRDFIMSDEVDVIVDVVDASCLERNLYLTLQLLELGKPAVVALNMMDIVQKRGMEIDLHRLPEMLGVPVIPVSARKKNGLEILLHAAVHHRDSHGDRLIHDHGRPLSHQDLHERYVMVYSDEIEEKIAQLMDRLQQSYPQLENLRWHAIQLLEQDEAITRKYPLETADIVDRSYARDLARQRYDFIEEVVAEVVVNKNRQEALTDRVDALLTHKIWSIPIFLGVMALVFFLTFTMGDWLKGYFEIGIEWVCALLSEGMIALHVAPILQHMVIDGIIAGVGGILTFLPNIIILFIALAILEDSGYMARVAYIMEGVMAALGLSGRAFIPLILGFGCTVPAIMASRALENKRDRLRVMLVTPFMSCSAKLPIYILFSQMFFGSQAMLAAYSMYLIGLLVAILSAASLHLKDGQENAYDLLIELPEYKMPDAHAVFVYVWQKVKDYVTKAGTTIFVASIVMWVLLNFGPQGYTENMAECFGAAIGRSLVWFFIPLGLGWWQVALALLAGITAKEVVVSSFAVLYGVANINADAGILALKDLLAAQGFTGINALCLMIFALLYIPCLASLATIRRESHSTSFMLTAAAFQLGTAWVVTFVVYQTASFLHASVMQTLVGTIVILLLLAGGLVVWHMAKEHRQTLSADSSN